MIVRVEKITIKNTPHVDSTNVFNIFNEVFLAYIQSCFNFGDIFIKVRQVTGPFSYITATFPAPSSTTLTLNRA